MKKIAEIEIDKCRRCFICYRYCLVGAIRMGEDYAIVDKNNCVGCGKCVNACPLGFIKIIEK